MPQRLSAPICLPFRGRPKVYVSQSSIKPDPQPNPTRPDPAKPDQAMLLAPRRNLGKGSLFLITEAGYHTPISPQYPLPFTQRKTKNAARCTNHR